MAKYIALIDRKNKPTECFYTKSTSATKALWAAQDRNNINTVTVVRCGTHEILSRIKWSAELNDFVQTSHPKYMEGE